MIPGLAEDVRLGKAEHERALNRARQQRSRDRKRNGNGKRNVVLLDDNGKPSPRLHRLLQAKLEGMGDSAALIDAGFSRHSTQMLDKVRKPLAEALAAHGLSVDLLAKSTRESVDATSPMLTAEGCIERPDWPARGAGRRDAIALLDRAGELPQAQAAQGNGNVTLILQSLNVHMDTDTIDCGSPQHVVTDSRFTSGDAHNNTQAIDITPSSGYR
jgi:hypothetical protein